MSKVRLGDIAEVITKGTTPTSLGYEFKESGINFIKIESITESGCFISDKFAHISSECHYALKRSQLKKNDVLFSIAGAIGRVGIVNDSIMMNPYIYFGEKNIWPRGFRINDIGKQFKQKILIVNLKNKNFYIKKKEIKK